MERHRAEQYEQAHRVGRAIGQRIDSDQGLHEEVAGDQEMHDHEGVADMVRGRPAEQRRVVEHPQGDHEERGGHNRIGEHGRCPGVHEDHDPLPRATTAIRAFRDSAQCEGDRRRGHEQHRDHHAEQHVPEHVSAEEIFLVDVDAAVRHPKKEGEAGEPQYEPVKRPFVTAAVQPHHTGDVEEREERDEQHPEDVEAPGGEVTREGELRRQRSLRQDPGRADEDRVLRHRSGSLRQGRGYSGSESHEPELGGNEPPEETIGTIGR